MGINDLAFKGRDYFSSHLYLLFSTSGEMPRRTIWISNAGPGLSYDRAGHPEVGCCFTLAFPHLFDVELVGKLVQPRIEIRAEPLLTGLQTGTWFRIVKDLEYFLCRQW